MAIHPVSVIAGDRAEAVVSVTPGEQTPLRPARWKRWLRWILLALVCLWAVDAGVSVLIQHGRFRSRLTARLAGAFGRPVEVGRYNFTLWKGPALEARSVTVAEDPRFGHEYFVRADSLRVNLRWRSLLLGHIEMGTLSLSGLSVNLVRNAGGDWNIDEWLPRPEASSPQGPVAPAPSFVSRFRRIEVDAGRVNFKRGDEKLPFAFLDVQGAVEMNGAGRWRLDLEASPWRAAVPFQQPGTIHVTGDVGGTSSRLLPAALNFTWTGASLSDLLRLARGDDYGIRGTVALAVSARTEGSTWTLHGRAELHQVHRWDLALRPDNPSLNLIAQMKLYPGDSRLEFTDAEVETPYSNAHASVHIAWNRAPTPSGNGPPPFYLELSESRFDLRDLLAWVRAFHSGVSDDISLRGWAGASAVVSGWPPHVASAHIASGGTDLVGSASRVLAHLGPVEFQDNQDRISLLPVTLTLGASPGPSFGSFHLGESIRPGRGQIPMWRLTGNLTQVRDLIATAESLGWNLSRGWNLAGPFRCDLRWQGTQLPWRMQSVGFVELGDPEGGPGSSLGVPFLNLPIGQIRARADWKPGARHIALTSAQAFGARWNGTFDRLDSDGGWQFALEADRLSTADLDRWLDPRWRESFLDRMLPFLGSRVPSAVVPENLRASGRVSLGQFTLAPLAVRHLQGNIKIGGRHIELTNASGQFYGGQVAGSLDAELQANPVYRVNASFSNVDLSAISAASPRLDGLFAGSVSGAVSFDARGVTRGDLLASLECQGAASANDAALRNLGLAESLRGTASRPGTSAFREASAIFTCGGGKVQFQDLWLRGSEGEIAGEGSAGFNGNLDFRMTPLLGGAALQLTKTPDPSQHAFQIAGTLAAPQITQVVSRSFPRLPR